MSSDSTTRSRRAALALALALLVPVAIVRTAGPGPGSARAPKPLAHAQAGACPRFASQASRIGAETKDVAVVGQRAYLALGARIRILSLDVDDEGEGAVAALDTIGEIALPSEIASLRADEARQRLFAATEAGALHAFDLRAEPPRPLAAASIGEEAPELALWDGRVFAGTLRGRQRVLRVIELREGGQGGAARLEQVGEMSSAPSGPLYAQNGFLYAEGWLPNERQRSLVAIDVRRPAAPRLAGGMPYEGGVNDLVFDGALGYLAASSGGVRVLDLADPSQPRIVFDEEDAPRAGLRQLALAGGRLHASRFGMLSLYDLANPKAPSLLSQAPLSPEPRSIAPAGTGIVAAADGRLSVLEEDASSSSLRIGARSLFYAHTENHTRDALLLESGRLFAGSVGEAIHGFELADPARPSPLGASLVGQGKLRLATGAPGQLIATANSGHVGNLLSLHSTGPDAPRIAAMTSLPGAPGAAKERRGRIYLNMGTSHVPETFPGQFQELAVFDAARPDLLERVGQIEPPGNILAFSGDVGFHYLAGELRPLDLSDPDAPAFGAPLAIPDVRDALVLEERLFLSTYDALEILDIAEPMAPRRQGALPLSGRLLAADGGCLFLSHDADESATRRLGVHVVDASAEDEPAVVADLSLDGRSHLDTITGLQVRDGWLYVSAPELLVLALDRVIPTPTPIPSPPPLPTMRPTEAPVGRIALPWAER